jgi:hypothetical protein
MKIKSVLFVFLLCGISCFGQQWSDWKTMNDNIANACIGRDKVEANNWMSKSKHATVFELQNKYGVKIKINISFRLQDGEEKKFTWYLESEEIKSWTFDSRGLSGYNLTIAGMYIDGRYENLIEEQIPDNDPRFKRTRELILQLKNQHEKIIKQDPQHRSGGGGVRG